jgi:hypothetical protein
LFVEEFRAYMKSRTPPPMPEWDPVSCRLHGELVEVVREYRSAGWFEQFAGQPDEVVAEVLRAQCWPDDCEEFDVARAGYGNFALADTERVIGLDPEADTSEGNHVYVGVLRRLAKITLGALVMTDVSEDWRSEPGRVIVSLVANGQPRQLRLHQLDDWVDPKVITLLNAMVAEQARRFYCFDTGGQMYPITFATPEQAAAMNAFGKVRLLDRAPDEWPGIREP